VKGKEEWTSILKLEMIASQTDIEIESVNKNESLKK
jgi:hypothetical protein